ncbi:MAG: hypothetical protein ABJN22_06505 [Litorimonas sp.]
MADPKRFMVGCILPSILLVLLSVKGCSTYFNSTWKNALPQEIEVGKTLARSTDIISSPGGSCGGAVFRLRKETRDEILEKGFRYFADKSNPRNLTTSSISWKQDDVDGRLGLSFECVTKKHHSSGVRKAIDEGRAYYGIMDGTAFNTRILIVPDEELVFVGYWD